MQFYDIVQHYALKKKTSLEAVSLKLGKNPTYISSARSRGSLPKIDTAAKIVSVFGCVICAVPSDNVPEKAIVIDSSKEAE